MFRELIECVQVFIEDPLCCGGWDISDGPKQATIIEPIDRLQGELNIAYMFVMHDLATMKSIADEVVVMQYGAVVERWPKAVLFADPNEEYTRLLLSSAPEMDPAWLNRLQAALSGKENQG